MGKTLGCGCTVEAGGRVEARVLLAHVTEHIPAGLEDAIERVLLPELIPAVNRDAAAETGLADVRIQLAALLERWREAQPAVERVVRTLDTAEALGR
jgi:hypothetical protein